MGSAWIWILVLGVAAWFWLDSARAREIAIGVAENMCQRRHLQFLDETVGLQRIGLRQTGDGLRVRRMFGFDFSIEGVGRRRGQIVLVGTRLEQFVLDMPPEPPPPPAGIGRDEPQAPDHECKVLPFPRSPRNH